MTQFKREIKYTRKEGIKGMDIKKKKTIWKRMICRPNTRIGPREAGQLACGVGREGA